MLQIHHKVLAESENLPPSNSKHVVCRERGRGERGGEREEGRDERSAARGEVREGERGEGAVR